MEYFKSFNDIPYRFGQEESTVFIQDLSAYADIIDQVKDDIAVYEKGYIREGQRPDQLSFELYGTTIYHWTFYLLNDNLRLQGWPLTNTELEATVKERYSNTVLTTRQYIFDKFKVGQTVQGTISAATGKIIHRNLDLGQITIKSTNGFTFRPGEAVTSNKLVDGVTVTESIVIISSQEEYNAAHHYLDGDRIIDIDPTICPGQQNVEVTNYEYYRDENEKLRDIKIIRPNIIENLAASYKQAISA